MIYWIVIYRIYLSDVCLVRDPSDLSDLSDLSDV